MNKQNETPIHKAIKSTGGNASELARRLGVSSQCIYNIRKRGGNLTTSKISVATWCEKTGLSRKELFPEFYN